MGVGQCHALAWHVLDISFLIYELRTTEGPPTQDCCMDGPLSAKHLALGLGHRQHSEHVSDYIHTIPSPQGQLISLSHLSSRDGNQELTTEPQPRVATWYMGERGPCACLASELSGSQRPSAAPPLPQISHTTGPGGNHSKEPPSEGSARARPRAKLSAGGQSAPAPPPPVSSPTASGD